VRNSLRRLVKTFEDNLPNFACRSIGVDVDPNKMTAARGAIATVRDLHKRAGQGEFAPTRPFDSIVLL
jgi:hypothetical protein